MKTTIRVFSCLLSLFIFAHSPAKADHFAGGEFQWQQLGVDSYFVTLILYNNCASTTTMSSTDIEVSDSIKNYTYPTKMTKGLDVTPRCKRSCNSCTNGSCSFGYGFRVYTYTATIVLTSKFKGCEIRFSWQGCCRSYNSTNFGVGQQMYVEATLNRCYGIDNSPYFATSPLFLIPQGNGISYLPGGLDVDSSSKGVRDSLVYALEPPLTAGPTTWGGKPIPIKWTTPFSYDKPLTFDSFPKAVLSWNPPDFAGFHLNSKTGEINFKANKVESTLLTYSITEYRKDTFGVVHKIGKITRDAILYVLSSTNTPPTLTGINGTKSNDIIFYTGKMNSFTINSNDVNYIDTVILSWNKSTAIKGATFGFNSKWKHPIGYFRWNPDSTMIRFAQYVITINASDKVCPIEGRTTRELRVYVQPDDLDTLLISSPNCGNVSFNALPKKGSKIATYLWKGDDGLYSTASSLKHHYRNPGTYKYSLSVDNGYGHGHTDSGSVIITSHIETALPKDTLVCDSTTLLISSITSGGSTPYKYLWSTGQITSSINAKITKDTSFIIIAGDSNCSSTDTIKIKDNVLAPPSIILIGTDTLECSLTSHTYLWYKDNIKLSDTTRSILVSASGNYKVQIFDSLGCSAISSPYNYGLTGIENVLLGAINIYPNPATGILTIETPNINEGQLSIINMLGQTEFQCIISTKKN